MRATLTNTSSGGGVSESLTLILADDHLVLLDGLTAVLTQYGHRILAAVSTIAALDEKVRTLRPNICLIEVQMEDRGVETVARLASSFPRTHVVVLTGSADSDMLQKSLSAGAAGFVHKTRGIDVVLDVLRRVSVGEIAVEASFVRPATRFNPHTQRLATYLTPREQECLVLLTAGQDTATMAGSLGVSTTTIRSHVQAVLNKLGVHSRLEAASLAVRHRLVEPDHAGHAPPIAMGGTRR